ncbi:farnesyl pyrophosphate synthase-like isoform X2 [Apis cerana]|uniref:farnesyl pyrophosphate synthase-like isoform X2 n=1 Tax=Apis cerana TaxID=7461 RepID=UPI002B23338E|nr:farnesyl pyrophosphate synthase-like isoform X2 [Apis cerana]
MFHILSRYINLCERNKQKIFNFINIRKNSLWWKCQESRYSLYKTNMPLKYHTNDLKINNKIPLFGSNNVQEYVNSFKDEKNELMGMWPDIVHELMEEDNEELPDVKKWIKEILEYNVPKGGKRRSVSLVIAYKLLASQDQLTEENIRLARILAWSVEIMQAFYTMIDDILDNANMRRIQPTWHAKIGLGAVNDGLFMEACTYKLIKKHFKSKNCYTDIVDIFLKYHTKTTHGECLDILISTDWRKNANFNVFFMDRYNDLAKYKTSYFGFMLPFSIAMRFAGIIDPEMHKEAENILIKMGHFFQVQNDFLDYYSKEEIGGKSGTDIQEGRCTWPIVVALERATTEQKRILKECYGVADEEKVKRVKEIYEEIDQIMYSNMSFKDERNELIAM